MTITKVLKVFGPKHGGGRKVYPIYESFQELMSQVPKVKGGGASPDEIINWFKKNKPNKVEKILGMNISNARDTYSNAKTAFKKSQNVEKNIKNLVEKAKDFQKGGSVDKPLGAGG